MLIKFYSMKIFKSSQIKEIDKYTIDNEPVHSINLMERAAAKMHEWIGCRFDKSRRFIVFAGPGNNGGDGLALARLLVKGGYRVSVYLLKIKGLSPDSQTNLERLIKQGRVPVTFVSSPNEFPNLYPDEIIVDALFGSGLTRPLQGLPANCVNFMNHHDNLVLSIDIPSGLFGETNVMNVRNNIVQADYTLTLQFPKLAFFFAENGLFGGNWQVLPIGLHEKAMKTTETPWHYLSREILKEKIRPREKFSHKGTYGHALLIAGSHAKMGACLMGVKACLRTGVGLVTAHVPQKGYLPVQTAIPEAMLSLDENDHHFSTVPSLDAFDAIGFGPGIGKEPVSQSAFKELLEKSKKPLVIDADGINIISENKDWYEKIPKGSILTPHPGEFERIVGKFSDDYARNKKQMEFAGKHGVYLVLKGAYTAVATPEGKCYFNVTGNPGMATGGSGDALTGMILSFLAQQYPPLDAALLAVYLHGMAGDLAACQLGEQGLITTDIIENIPYAYKKLMEG